jgi:NAD(P)-dependent dehydrogenase (short-subunit alcohol dehydrogenase family)
MQTLHQKRVLVTGASGAVGPAIVEALLSVGASVVAGARRRTWLDALRADMRDHERLDVAEVDVTDPAGVDELVESSERHGGFDGVVQCAGAFSTGALADAPLETLDRMVRLNFFGSLLVTRAAVRAMRRRGRGSIVLVSAERALTPAAEQGAYGASKAAVAHLGQAVALETSGTGIRVNVVLPGKIDTEENRAEEPDGSAKRLVSRAAVARTAVWLVSDESRGVSGALLRLAPD